MTKILKIIAASHKLFQSSEKKEQTLQLLMS